MMTYKKLDKTASMYVIKICLMMMRMNLERAIMMKLNSKENNILKNIFIKYMEIRDKKMLEGNQLIELIGVNPKMFHIKRNKKYV
jgi:CRISPR/Cas system-associated endonuclease Cas3-HD